MPSTPPPAGSLRAHTPPTPLHGSRYDTYEPYSPRRSKRTSAHSNPYSSFNSPGAFPARDTTPPPTAKSARHRRAPTQLSSPPSSPTSPMRQTPHKTPRKSLFGAKKAAQNTFSDSDHAGPSLAAPTIDPITMLPTPSKTPKKRSAAAIHSTARILFQPNDPNDVMPSPRRIKKHSHQRSITGFELYDEDHESSKNKIEIFTDTNARVPEMDSTEDNPFIGSKMRPQRRSNKKGKAAADRDAEMERAVRNEEGVVYVFRGRKIFRRFSDAEDEEAQSAQGSDLGNSLEQRQLKRSAGTTAARPLTRSAVKPRLLFPSEEQIREREARANDVDEEALTDIELPVESKESATPHVNRTLFAATPPPTNRATKISGKNILIEADETKQTQTVTSKPNKKRNPFDSWQRTKGGLKRSNDGGLEGGASSSKRARSAAAEGSSV